MFRALMKDVYKSDPILYEMLWELEAAFTHELRATGYEPPTHSVALEQYWVDLRLSVVDKLFKQWSA